MIFYRLITDKVLKESDVLSVLNLLKRHGFDARFEGFEHIEKTPKQIEKIKIPKQIEKIKTPR